MTKQKFLSIVKRAIKFRAKPQTVPCRCVDCCNESKKRPNKTVSAVLK